MLLCFPLFSLQVPLFVVFLCWFKIFEYLTHDLPLLPNDMPLTSGQLLSDGNCCCGLFMVSLTLTCFRPLPLALTLTAEDSDTMVATPGVSNWMVSSEFGCCSICDGSTVDMRRRLHIIHWRQANNSCRRYVADSLILALKAFVYCVLLSSAFVYCVLLSSASVYCVLLSSASVYCVLLSSASVYCVLLSSASVYCVLLSSVSIWPDTSIFQRATTSTLFFYVLLNAQSSRHAVYKSFVLCVNFVLEKVNA